jgi:Ca2+-binding RTX toxin-like protein
MATLNGTAGADTLTGGAGNDLFNVTPGNLSGADIISGNGGFDTLQLTAGGSVGAGAQAGITGIERIAFAAAGNNLTARASVVSSAGGRLEVGGGAGNDRLDGSGLTDPALRLSFSSGGGNDTFLGGAGADTVSLGIGGLNGADSLSGGAGTDRLVLTTAGAVTAAALAGLSSIEEIAFAGLTPSSIEVTNAVAGQAGGVLTVIGNAFAQSVNAAALTGVNALRFVAGAGADSIAGGAGADTVEAADSMTGTLGAGDDVLRVVAAGAGKATLAGGDGEDAIVIGTTGGVVLGAGLTGFETVEIEAAGVQVTLNATAGLEVLGSDGADRVTLGAARQAAFGFAGNDTVVATAAQLAGVVLDGGTQDIRDVLVLTGGGSFDLRRVFLTGFERVAVEGAASRPNVTMGAQPVEVVLRGGANAVLGGNAAQSLLGSAQGDRVTLGAAGQLVATRGGADTILGNATTLGPGTLVDGGGGNDVLVLTGNGVDLRNGALVQNVETIQLPAAGAATLDSIPGLFVLGSAGADTVVAGTGNMLGDLGGQDDLVQILSTDLAAAAGSFSFGAGTDTLRILQAAAANDFTVPAHFIDAEVLDLQAIVFSVTITLAGSLARTVLMPSTPNALVLGGGGNEVFQFGPTGGYADGGAGADTMNGGAGNDVMFGRAGGDWLDGGAGGDTIGGGLGPDTMIGGAGNDLFLILDDAELADWAGPARTILGNVIGQNGTGLDGIVVGGVSGGQTLDLTRHLLQAIDSVLVGPGFDLKLVLGDMMATSAQALGVAGVVEVGNFLGATTGAMTIDASDFSTGSRLYVAGQFDGADSVIGGADGDIVASANGNDTVKAGDGGDSVLGGAGNDELRGEGGNDTVIGGAGLDSIWGDAGGDDLDGGAGDGASDRFAYNSNTNGSADINGAGGALNGADLIRNFVPRTGPADTVGDWIALSVAGLGLNGGASVKKLAENETWNAGTASIFVMHQLDTLGNSGSAGGVDFTDLAQIAAGVNADGGANSGFVAGRTVVFAMSNGESVATRQTGL